MGFVHTVTEIQLSEEVLWHCSLRLYFKDLMLYNARLWRYERPGEISRSARPAKINSFAHASAFDRCVQLLFTDNNLFEDFHDPDDETKRSNKLKCCIQISNCDT